MSKIAKWVLTDSDTKQYGRQLSPVIFEFKEKDRDATIIDVTAFTDEKIESCINSYGYTLSKDQKGLQNVFELYGKEANWIIAECLFEMDM